MDLDDPLSAFCFKALHDQMELAFMKAVGAPQIDKVKRLGFGYGEDFCREFAFIDSNLRYNSVMGKHFQQVSSVDEDSTIVYVFLE